MDQPRLYRSVQNRMIAGVAGGLGEYFSMDAAWIRLIWICAVILGGAGVLAYIIAWIVIPVRDNLPVRGAPSDATTVKTRHRFSFGAGIILIGLGFSLLLARLLSVNINKYIWPALLISLGIFILFGTIRRNPL